MFKFKESIRYILDTISLLRKEKIHRLLFVFVMVVAVFGTMATWYESSTPDTLFKNEIDGIWWAFVTIFTVGYGDKYPITLGGRIIAIAIMFSGLFLTVMISGTIASILVDRKMKEGKGLQKINLTNHIVICGYNQGLIKILEGFQAYTAKQKETVKIVLVNELEIDRLNEIQFTYAGKNLLIEIVRGNFTQEAVLEKASMVKAASAIILADMSAGAANEHNADERTILGSYTISSNFPAVRLSVELNNSQNEQYLKNTNVENIIVNGEFNSYMLINASVRPGIPRAAKELMNLGVGNNLTSKTIPGSYIGQNFSKLFEHFRDNGKTILIGVISESKKLSIDDFISDDPSAIDEFIKRKFAESEKDYFADSIGKANVAINPGWSYQIKENDKALVIEGSEG